MTTAELIKTLADLGYGTFLATTDRLDRTDAMSLPDRRTIAKPGGSIAVTNGAVLVCVAPQSDGPRVFVQVDAGIVVDHDIANAMRRAGVVPASTPTPEGADAEIQPKGLPVIELDGPTWVGPWYADDMRDGWTRWLITPSGKGVGNPQIARVRQSHGGTWHYRTTIIQVRSDIRGEGHPTPEAAQQACEAAIVAAWRNR